MSKGRKLEVDGNENENDKKMKIDEEDRQEIFLNAKTLSEVNKNEIEMSETTKTDTLDVDLHFCDFEESDFHMLKLLLLKNKHPLTLISKYDTIVSSLIDTILAYKATGTVVRLNSEKNELNEPSELCGFISLFHLYHKTSAQPWNSFISNISKDLVKNKDFSKIGLILTEKLINVPDKVSVEMYKNLIKDLEWSQSSCVEFGLEADCYSFKYFLNFLKFEIFENEKIFFKEEEKKLFDLLKEDDYIVMNGFVICLIPYQIFIDFVKKL